MSTFKRSEKGYPFVYNTDGAGGVTPGVVLVDPTTGVPYAAGGVGSTGSITAAGVNGTLAQAVQGITNGVPVPVDTLGTPGTPRVQATSGTAASIALTTTCRRISMYATQGTWYAITGTATVTSHYIASGERIDLDVPASTTVSVLQETTAGSIRITELV